MSGLMPPGPLSYNGQVAVPWINRTFPPTTSDIEFNVPTVWVDTAGQDAYLLVSKALGIATWITLGGVGPPSLYPITPYVVGPVGQAGYQTIQAAVNAAGAAGGGLVYVQEGSYTENITLMPNVNIQGAVDATIINGVHIPPSTGTTTFDSLILISATDIFNSAVAGSTTLNVNNSFIIITDGYVYNVPNWTGELLMDNCGQASTNDGVINNIGGSTVKLINVDVGAGNLNTMNITSGNFLRIDTCNINCPIVMGGSGSLIVQNGVKFNKNVTIGGSLNGYIVQTVFSTGSSQALTYNSSGNTFIMDVGVNSSNNPCIGGNGSGTLTISSIEFVDNSDIDNTLIISYGNVATGIALLDNISFDEGATTIDTDGQLIIGNTGNNPSIATLTAGAGVNIVNGPGSITISANNGGQTWTVVTTNQTLADSNGYFANGGGNLNFALPVTASVGDTYEVVAMSAGGWTITQNTGQQITLGTSTTTLTTGSIASTNQGDWIQLTCSIANTNWIAAAKQGTIFTVV